MHQLLGYEIFEGFVVHDPVEYLFIAVHAVKQQGFEVLVEDDPERS